MVLNVPPGSSTSYFSAYLAHNLASNQYGVATKPRSFYWGTLYICTIWIDTIDKIYIGAAMSSIIIVGKKIYNVQRCFKILYN